MLKSYTLPIIIDAQDLVITIVQGQLSSTLSQYIKITIICKILRLSQRLSKKSFSVAIDSSSSTWKPKFSPSVILMRNFNGRCFFIISFLITRSCIFVQVRKRAIPSPKKSQGLIKKSSFATPEFENQDFFEIESRKPIYLVYVFATNFLVQHACLRMFYRRKTWIELSN